MNAGRERRERPVIRLFGPLSIEEGGRILGPSDLGGTRPKQVLEILLAARGHLVPTDRLAELSGETSARRTWPAPCRRSSLYFDAISQPTVNVRASSW